MPVNSNTVRLEKRWCILDKHEHEAITTAAHATRELMDTARALNANKRRSGAQKVKSRTIFRK